MLSRWVRWPAVVLNFYAPWCPWCQRLEPTWEAVVTEVHTRYPESDGRIRMGKVDCTIEVELCRQHHITGFPSIRVFRKGSDDVTVHGVREHESYKGAFCEWAYRQRVYRLVQVTGFRSMAFHEHESYKGRRPRNSAAPCPPLPAPARGRRNHVPPLRIGASPPARVLPGPIAGGGTVAGPLRPEAQAAGQ